MTVLSIGQYKNNYRFYKWQGKYLPVLTKYYLYLRFVKLTTLLTKNSLIIDLHTDIKYM